MAGEIIRMGDPTSHGGRVIEGSMADICHDKPIAFVGHKTICPRCKGTFPIIEGAPTTIFYGKGVALAGMKTACGAVLIATQFTDIVEIGGASGKGGASENARKHQAETEYATGQSERATPAAEHSAATELEQYFEAIDSTGAPVNIVYRINSGQSKLTESALPPSGETEAFPLSEEAQLVFWKAPT
jgi:uncharacterized Zn-binding protein involved in type VI secretion